MQLDKKCEQNLLNLDLLMFRCVRSTLLWPLSKSKFNLMSDCVNLIAPGSPIACLPYLPNVWGHSTHWDRKGWPGSEIQMYYGSPWIIDSISSSYSTVFWFSLNFLDMSSFFLNDLFFKNISDDLFLMSLFRWGVFPTV